MPAGRLFAAGALPGNGGPSLIYDLNPGTGAVLNSFAAPELAGGGTVGLAFDGTHLFYLNGLGSDLLYELNPTTGAVLDSDLITAGSGNYDGLAVVGGQVFVQDYTLNTIHVFDPVGDTITRTVTPTAATFGPDLAGGLAGATGPDGLIGPINGGNLIAEFNPTTGAFVQGFQPGTGPFLGAAVVDNVIYLGFGNKNAIRMYSRTGAALGQITIPVPVVALGGDGVSVPPPRRTRTSSTAGSRPARRPVGRC
ncbi:NHL repeat-containing protein [Limnoglobus roseus]|uniref:Uncharacterized protein n=1 Tax=Limnoglobus roseus TaxID=2598579 RepID=A0A5C1AA18_9BACT|nr:hypothetical protein [Limnoglobus roseus]QEL14662.1 hypothetical protein PX52LOC_01555 [Limnoglobus roseus]